MMNRQALVERSVPYAHALLRITTGLLFLPHGMHNILGWPVHLGHDKPAPFEPSWIAGTILITCGPLLIVGLFTRPAAFLLSGLMAFAYFMAHAKHGFFPFNNGGESAALFCFVSLFLAAAGPGALSLDQTLFRRRSTKKLVEEGPLPTC